MSKEGAKEPTPGTSKTLPSCGDAPEPSAPNGVPLPTSPEDGFALCEAPPCIICGEPIEGDMEETADGYRHSPPCDIRGSKPRRKKPFRTNAASLKLLRDAGWVADTVERRNGPYTFDYLGFADIIALRSGVIAAIQVTTTGGGGVRERIEKVKASRHARKWLRNGGVIEVWGWGKVKEVRGGKAYSWQLKRRIGFALRGEGEGSVVETSPERPD